MEVRRESISKTTQHPFWPYTLLSYPQGLTKKESHVLAQQGISSFQVTKTILSFALNIHAPRFWIVLSVVVGMVDTCWRDETFSQPILLFFFFFFFFFIFGSLACDYTFLSSSFWSLLFLFSTLLQTKHFWVAGSSSSSLINSLFTTQWRVRSTNICT